MRDFPHIHLVRKNQPDGEPTKAALKKMKLFVIQKSFQAETFSYPTPDARAAALKLAETVESGDRTAIAAEAAKNNDGWGCCFSVALFAARGSRNRGCSAARFHGLLADLADAAAALRAFAAKLPVESVLRHARTETLLTTGWMGEGDSNWKYFRSESAALRAACAYRAEVRRVTGDSHDCAMDFGVSASGERLASLK